MTQSTLKQLSRNAYIGLAFLFLSICYSQSASAQSQNSVRLTLSLGNSLTAESNTLQFSADANAADQASLTPSPAPNLALSIENSKKMNGTVRGKRVTTVSEDSIVIRLLGANGAILFEDVKPDPRVIRAEVPDAGAGGALVDRKHFKNDTAFLIDVPDIASATTLQILKPVLSDNGFTLSLVSSVDMN